MPSTRRCSSRNGTSPPPSGRVSASVTRRQPPSVKNVVSSTFVSGRYRRSVRNRHAGRSEKRPPRATSRSAANTVGESRSGRVSQSIDPPRATSATHRPSPIAAYSRSGRFSAVRPASPTGPLISIAATVSDTLGVALPEDAGLGGRQQSGCGLPSRRRSTRRLMRGDALRRRRDLPERRLARRDRQRLPVVADL